MNLIFDNIIFSLQQSGGISVYWHEIISRIINQKGLNSIFIEEGNLYGNIFRKELEIDKINLCDNDTKFPKYLSRYRTINLNVQDSTFIFHSTYYRTLSKAVKKNNNVKEVVTVHDFTYEHFSKGLKKWVHCYQKKKAISAADVIICISENTKKDLLYFFPEFLFKDIRVIYNGVSDDYFVIKELKSNLETKPYFLFVGSRASYKNFDFSIKAIAQTEKYGLKIVGSKLNQKELRMLDELLPERWELLTNIENTKLNELYNNAFALIYPSSYEGFGIPLLEAMMAGCPFIAFKNSSIPEVAGDAGVLMDKLEISFFNEAVSTISSKREEIIKMGFEQAKKFSWEKCYKEIMNVYKELINKN